MNANIGRLEVGYGARGTATYRIELSHDGLKKHRVIQGREQEVVRRKAEMQVAGWNEKWRQLAARVGLKSRQEAGKNLATQRTAEAQGELSRLTAILQHTLGVDDAIVWEGLKNKQSFPERGRQDQTSQPSHGCKAHHLNQNRRISRISQS